MLQLMHSFNKLNYFFNALVHYSFYSIALIFVLFKKKKLGIKFLNKAVYNRSHDDIYSDKIFYKIIYKILPIPTKKDNLRKPKKIIFIVDRIKLGKKLSHVNFYCGIASSLASINKNTEITLFISNEGTITVGDKEKYSSQGYKDYRYIEKQAKRLAPHSYNTNFFIEMIDPKDGPGIKPILKAWNFIWSREPDVLLYFGGNLNESKILRRVLYKYFPTIFLFTQIKNEPDKYCDLIVPPVKVSFKSSIDKRKIRVVKYPGPFLPDNEYSNRKLPFSKNPSDLIIATILSGNRIQRSFENYSDETVKNILGILDSIPNARWIFVGITDSDSFYNANKELYKKKESNQIVTIEYIDDLISFMEQVDLFLHLPRLTGGGGGASIAISKDVPVLTFRYSDVAARVPEQSIFEDNEISLFKEKAEELLKNPNLRVELSNLQGKFMNNISEKAKYKLYKVCIEATKNFQKRE